MRKIWVTTAGVCLSSLLSACTLKPGQPGVDHYERYNRAVFAFNTDVDRLFIRPVAKIYDTVLPPPLKKGVTNVFFNLGMITTVPNDILQGKVKWALTDLWRLIINSTVGIGGLFDVATRIGFPKHYEDFGLTLAYWSGDKEEPYFMLPLLGPNTTRSAFGIGIDYLMSPWPYLRQRSITWTLFAINYINTRARFLDTDKFIEQAYDPYVFTRNAYLQIRRNMIRENREPYKSLAQRRAEKSGDKPFVSASGVTGVDKWNDSDKVTPPTNFDFDTGMPIGPTPPMPTKPSGATQKK